MTNKLEEIPRRVSEVLGGLIARWVPVDRLVGDYDGRQRTLEVFDVPPGEQRVRLRQLRALRPEIERAIEGPLIVIFHTPGETARLYPEISVAHRRHELALRMARWAYVEQGDAPSYDPDRIESLDLEAA
jgi:hypothetical protein